MRNYIGIVLVVFVSGFALRYALVRAGLVSVAAVPVSSDGGTNAPSSLSGPSNVPPSAPARSWDASQRYRKVSMSSAWIGSRLLSATIDGMDAMPGRVLRDGVVVTAWLSESHATGKTPTGRPVDYLNVRAVDGIWGDYTNIPVAARRRRLEDATVAEHLNP